MRRTSLVASLVVLAFASPAAAETFQVGPSKVHKDLQAVQGLLKPGDVVEVDGDATYPGGVYIRAAQSGTAGQKVTIRGVKVNGKRPVISGGGAGVLDGLGMVLNGSHYVLESLEVTASTNTCVIHKGDDITIRDFVVHDCPGHGLLGHDDEAGSLVLELSEFYKNGNGTFQHQIYMATGQEMYPGSVFRMQHCYVHDGNGGNNVKSRSERNEIYANWIEGAYYHGLELIGPDKSPATPAREDSDVVGNVIVGNGSQKWHLVRVGGDKDEADTSGRYRFVNNTFVVGSQGNASIVRLMLRIDTVEMHNNAFVQLGAGAAPVFATSEVAWVAGTTLFGSNNWVQSGVTGAPASWTGTLTGGDPGLTNLAQLDLRPKEGSALLDKGASGPASVTDRPFPKPLSSPAFVPPSRQRAAAASPRPAGGTLDIGAYELGTGVPPGPGGTDAGTSSSGGASSSGGSSSSSSGAGSASSGGSSSGIGGGQDGGPETNGAAAEDGGCGCGLVGAHRGGALAAAAMTAMLVLVGLRRQRRPPTRDS